MAKELNLREIVPGDRIRLIDGTELEVLENPGDGAWLICAPESQPEERDAVFVADILGDFD